MNLLSTVCATWLLLLCVVHSEQFVPRGVELLANGTTPTSLAFKWDRHLYNNALYKVWFWPSNASASSDVTMTTVYDNHVTLSPLIPGEMYTVWLFGMLDGNVSYCTLVRSSAALTLGRSISMFML